MARKSVAALSVVPAGAPAPAAPPSDLTEKQAELWRVCIDSKPAAWFGEDSLPILKEYVRCVTMCDLLEERLRSMDTLDLAAWKLALDMRDKESRRAATLATKLRLTQQSRYTPQAANTANNRAAGRRPWQRD